MYFGVNNLVCAIASVLRSNNSEQKDSAKPNKVPDCFTTFAMAMQLSESEDAGNFSGFSFSFFGSLFLFLYLRNKEKEKRNK